MNKLAACFKIKPKPKEESRIIYPSIYLDVDQLNDFIDRQISNKIKTTKYNIFTFIPLNLFEQFKRFANIYFILIVCLNFVPQISAFGKELAPLPILFVLCLTAVKDGVEDLRRWQSDRAVNSTPCLLYNPASGVYEVASWQDICPGDFVKISANETIPADILIFRSSELSGNCYIETANLDGEINLKQREIVYNSNKKGQIISPNCFADSFLEVESPNREIYKFNGKWIFDDASVPVTLKKSNLILRGCVLRNTEFVEGIVIYTGHETKSILNNNKLTFKRSKLEEQINKDVIWCVGILLILCLACAVGNSVWLSGFNNVYNIAFFTFTNSTFTNPALQGFYVFWTSLIFFQAIIPLPLYVTIELVKLHQVFHITRDLELYDESVDKRIQVRAYNITEDMGQIQHMFCDKTGTLTENSMEFKRATIGSIDYYDESCVPLNDQNSLPMSSISRLLRKFSKSARNDDDVSNTFNIEEFILLLAICNTTMVSENKNQSKIVVGMPKLNNSSNTSVQKQKNVKEVTKKHSIINNFSLFGIEEIKLPEPPPQIGIEESFSIPKNLKFTESEKSSDNKSLLSDNSKMQKGSSISKLQRYNSNRGQCPYTDETLFKFYESESPDETALVKTACNIGIKLLQRGPGFVCVWKEYKHKAFELDILCVLPFDSVRKRMSVIFMDPETGIITLYCKGADNTMVPILNSDTDVQTLRVVRDNITQYSKMGLRTLVMGKKDISEKVYLQWNDRLRQIEQSFNTTENDLIALYSEIEKDLILLGATGIEDKLQEQVPECIESFRRAGINVWILTGDKLETAINIAYSAKLFSEKQEVFVLTGTYEEDVLGNIISFMKLIHKTRLANSTSTKYNEIHDEYGLVLEGETLSVVLGDIMLRREFLNLAGCCNSVVCCRSTPNQKADIVNLIKRNLHVRTLAIGDGANDVNMIQAAHVGIGIGGKEGMQAVMASDFAITKFKYLRRLLLVHGHRCYDQLARMSLYMFYKDTIIVLVLFWFQVFNGFSVSVCIDQISLALFNLTITGLPPLILGIWDKDFEAKVLEKNPQIYQSGIKLKSYRPRDFWRNIVDSIWQSLVIFWFTYLCYRNTEIDMGEFGIMCVNALVLTTFTHLLIESRFWGPFHWFACIGSLSVAWFGEVFFLNSLCVVVFDCKTDNPYKVVNYTMAQPKTYVVLPVVVATALLPRIAFKSFLLTTKPSVIYEAQRRLNKYPWSQRGEVYLGDLESYKIREAQSKISVIGIIRRVFRRPSVSHELKPMKMQKSNRVTPQVTESNGHTEDYSYVLT